MTDALCWKCGTAINGPLRSLQRSDRCTHCDADLYCCRMCRHYAPQLQRRCAEDKADPPRDADRANFCDWFDPKPSAYTGTGNDQVDAARQALEDLFRK